MIPQDDLYGRLKLAQAILHYKVRNADWIWEDKEFLWSIGKINEFCPPEDTYIAGVDGFINSFIVGNGFRRSAYKITIQNLITVIKDGRFNKEQVKDLLHQLTQTKA